MNDAIEIFNEGVSHFQDNQLLLAMDAFDRALQRDPGLAVAYNGRAVVHALHGEMERGIEDSSKAIDLAPEDPRFYRTRGLILREMGETGSAETDLAKAEELGYVKP